MRKIYSRSHANRGAKLELIVDMTNNQYRNKQMADVRKVPTPVKILNTSGNRVAGHLEKATWVDYSGIYKGHSIIFDAKETKLKNFPLKNISQHQYQLLQSWHRHGAVAFILVAFWLKEKNEPEIYVLQFEQLEEAWLKSEAGGAKSIPLAFFQGECIRVKQGNGVLADYLSVLDI